MVTNSFFNIYMSLYKFVESLSELSFTSYFHDVAKLSPVLQGRIASETRYGYVYCRMLAAAPSQDTVLTIHLAGRDITNPGLHIWLKDGMEKLSDAFRTKKIPFLNFKSAITEQEWASFLQSADISAISSKLETLDLPCYVHNGDDIQFFLAEFGEIEEIDTVPGSIGLAVQITLKHYAPDNIASLSS